MRVYIFTLAVLVVAILVPSNAEKTIGDHIKECKKELEIPEGTKKFSPQDPKFKCFLTCMKKKFGVIVDGKVNADAAIKFYSKKKELEEAIKHIIKECADAANKLSDCEVGYTYLKCLHEKQKGKKSEVETKKENNEE
ncbi:general odorant-binding protein 56d-like [Copidosoma floridanum]|uniref:general odorant-binding protein 56d-like n=1 Tax=Copidosoma floridanum TaxID=29053 RepID=UPI0006C94BA0|nr:general odorant-binding protein 56d-like [Copidosoma floridanum]